MRLERDGAGWKALTSYGEPSDRQRVKAAGFAWESARQVWTTANAGAAVALLETLAPEEIGEGVAEGIAALAEVESAKVAAAVAASSATDADIDIPAPDGLSYMPFQRAGIAALRDRLAAGTAGVLLADEMGLGKTIQVLGILNLALAEPGRDRLRVLVIAPKIALLNWRDEIQKWLVKPLSVAVWTTGARPAADIVIVNYDIVSKVRDDIDRMDLDYLVADEAHALKEGKAQRTKAVLGGKGAVAIAARHRIFVTGTPILNRPIELFPILKACGVDYARDYFGYAKRYCDGRQERFGFQADGATNLEELQERLRSTVMVRRLKQAVLTELPDKVHQVVTIDPRWSEPLRKALGNEARALLAHEKALAKAEAARAKAEARADKAALDRAVAALTALRASSLGEIAALRQRTALAKAPDVVAHALDILESVKGAILVFGHHREVIAALAEGFRAAGHEPAIITGETSPDDRQQAQDDIQGHRKRVFIGSMHACGIAITLTAAANVVFAEQDWSPGIMAQAEDRAHRIGQTGSVLVQYLVVDGSIDATLMRTSHAKATTVADALDIVPDEAADPISVALVEAENSSAETTPAEQPEAVPVIEQEQETPAEPEPETIFVAVERSEEVAYAEPPAEEPIEPPAEVPVAATPEPVRRKRGRPPLGDKAMSAAERSRRFRQSHGDGTRVIRLPRSLVARLEAAAERRCITVDVALTFALDELDRGYRDARRRRAA